MAEILNISAGAYNGAFSKDKLEGGAVTSRGQRIEELDRNSVSNRISAVINQATGVLVGVILIFLALHISFQDNTHDILILNMLGCHASDIRKLLVDVYLPVLWAAFAATLAPSILLARAIQNSFSVSTGDYMPFGVNAFVIIMAFVLVHLIYYGMLMVFHFRIRKIIEKGEMAEIIYGE